MSKNARISFRLPATLYFMAAKAAKEHETSMSKWLISAMIEKMIRDEDVKIIEVSQEDD